MSETLQKVLISTKGNAIDRVEELPDEVDSG
jgi:hypothetical protein